MTVRESYEHVGMLIDILITHYNPDGHKLRVYTNLLYLSFIKNHEAFTNWMDLDEYLKQGRISEYKFKEAISWMLEKKLVMLEERNDEKYMFIIQKPVEFLSYEGRMKRYDDDAAQPGSEKEVKLDNDDRDIVIRISVPK